MPMPKRGRPKGPSEVDKLIGVIKYLDAFFSDELEKRDQQIASLKEQLALANATINHE